MGIFYVSFMGQFFMQMIIEYFPLNSLLISMANNEKKSFETGENVY